MAARQFLYFVPGGARPNLKAMQAAGLGYAFESACPVTRVLAGPDGREGHICAAVSAEVLRYEKAQKWRQIPGKDIWVGFDPAAPPRAEDLVREPVLDGHMVRSSDGDLWLVPKARLWVTVDDQLAWSYGVPRAFDLDAEGHWVYGDVKARYRRLWDLACRYADMLFGLEEGEDGFQFDDAHALFVEALQANYRVSAVEVGLLGIYDDQTQREVLNATIDLPTWTDWVKKKALEQPVESGSPGCTGASQPSADCPPTTDLPSPA